MIELLGGRLYQWDLDRHVAVSRSIQYVHFANKHTTENALIVEPYENEDGLYVADVPNALLVNGEDICVYDWKGGRTIGARILTVLKRSKPSDYVYTPTEVLNTEKLKDWVLEQLEQFALAKADDYTILKNKPRIEGVELVGDRQISEFGVNAITNEDIDQMF